jgi:hypothetical protein
VWAHNQTPPEAKQNESTGLPTGRYFSLNHRYKKVNLLGKPQDPKYVYKERGA